MPLARPALVAVLLAPAVGLAQPVLNQVDTFDASSSSTLNWSQGGNPPPPAPPVGLTIQPGGPPGSVNFLQITADGSADHGKIVTFNRVQWQGNYTAAGI